RRHDFAARRLHHHASDLVHRDLAADGPGEIGEARVHAVANAAAARLVAREALLVEDHHIHAPAGEGERGERARRPAAHHDDLGLARSHARQGITMTGYAGVPPVRPSLVRADV